MSGRSGSRSGGGGRDGGQRGGGQRDGGQRDGGQRSGGGGGGQRGGKGGAPRGGDGASRQGKPAGHGTSGGASGESQRRVPSSKPSRRDDNQRLVVGLHPVREALRAGLNLIEVLIDKDRERTDVAEEILELAKAASVKLLEVERTRIDDVAEGMVHQGVVARGGPFPYAALEDCKRVARGRGEPLFLVALDGVTDPHNLGAIARSAEGFGAHGLLIPSRRAAGVTPVVEKAAAGALAHLPIVRVTNLVNTLRALKEENVWVLGLDSNDSEPIADCQLLTEPLVLVVGSEGKGLGSLTQITCDALVRLPMRGRVGSFNASVAAAVACHEVMRRREVLRVDATP